MWYRFSPSIYVFLIMLNSKYNKWYTITTLFDVYDVYDVQLLYQLKMKNWKF